MMDTKKWKSILVPREIYDEVKEMASEEGRTIGGQLKIIIKSHKKSKEYAKID